MHVHLTQEYFALFSILDTFIINAKSMAIQSQVLSTQSLNISVDEISNGNCKEESSSLYIVHR